MARWWQRRVDLVEVALAAGLIGGGVWLWTVTSFVTVPSPEAGYFKENYGPDRNSERNEEWLIRDFFRGKRDGTFVDVGASHYRDGSNTFYLETELGWSGLAIDPLQQFEADYIAHRPRTRFRAFFVSDVSDDRAKLYVSTRDSRVSSGRREFTETRGDVSEVEAPTITLDDLLDREGMESFDFLNMDIELWEPKALAGFDIERFRPSLVCIEAHLDVRQQILDYFAHHGYVLVGKYLRADVWNLYFTPLGPPRH